MAKVTRIPLDIVVTATGKRTPGQIVAVFGEDVDHLEAVAEAAAAILRPARGDAPWLHTTEFNDLRAALEKAGY